MRYIVSHENSPNMMTSSNGNIFRVTGPLCREFTGQFPAQRPVAPSFDAFFDLCLNNRLSKQSRSWLFGTPSCSLWRHSNEEVENPSKTPYGKNFRVLVLPYRSELMGTLNHVSLTRNTHLSRMPCRHTSTNRIFTGKVTKGYLSFTSSGKLCDQNGT